MVFGNTGERSGSGVAFTRDPIDRKAQEQAGDFLLNAQGEDVVAGVRNTEDLDDLAPADARGSRAPPSGPRPELERHYRDIQDVEYTVEDGRLYILQTRKRQAPRTGRGALRRRCGSARACLSREEALRKVDPASLDALLHPASTAEHGYTELTRGSAGSPGAAKGGDRLHGRGGRGAGRGREDVIFVRPFTSADDVGGFHAAPGS